jgi:Chalcone isomerase-like
MKRLAAAVLALALAAPAMARKVGGRDFPDAIEAGGQKLVLNGGGLRKKLFIKVYAAALYVPQPSREDAAVVALDAPKAVWMSFLRDLSRSQVMGAFREGFEKNSAGPGLTRLLAKLDEVAAAIPEELKDGQDMSVTYVPGEGTTVQAAGGRKVTVPGKEFADALFRNWLGPKPADDDLKAGLLGR